MSIKKLLGSLFAGMGALFVVIAAAVGFDGARFYAAAERTTGEVVALRRSSKGGGAPDVAFTTRDGQPRVYRSTFYSTPSYRIGDRVPIAYDPADPERVGLDTFSERWLLPAIFGGLGTVELIVGVTLLQLRRRRKLEIERLLRDGPRIDAKVVGVEQDRKVRINKKHPWFIRCEATLPGESDARSFTSRRFMYDPSDRVAGRTLPVHYDPKDPARHVVDTGDLPTRL